MYGNLCGGRHSKYQRAKHAVILSGGGGSGAFEIGVMKGLITGQSSSTNYQSLDEDIFTGTSWTTGEVTIFGNVDMTDADGVSAIMASTAIPGIFGPVLVKGQPAVDAGIVMNTPLVQALQAGADVIYLIYLDSDPHNSPLGRLQSTMDTLDRMLTIQFAINIKEDMATVNWINRGLNVMERVARGHIVSDADTRDFIRAAGVIEQRIRDGAAYKKVTAHRYRPCEDLGGVLRFLNYRREIIAEPIDIWFDFGCQYDPPKESIISERGMRVRRSKSLLSSPTDGSQGGWAMREHERGWRHERAAHETVGR